MESFWALEAYFVDIQKRFKAQLRAKRKNLKQARILHSQCSQYHTDRGRSSLGYGDYTIRALRMGERAVNEASQRKL